MQTGKILKKSTILLSVLLCLTVMLSAGISTLRVGAVTESSIESFYQMNAQMVANSGADKDDCFTHVYQSRAGSDLEIVYKKLNLIVHIADTRIRVSEDCSDAKLEELTYESRLHAKAYRDEFLEFLVVERDRFFGNDILFEEWEQEYRETLDQMQEHLNELVFFDDTELEEYLNKKAGEIYEHYKGLISFTLENSHLKERDSSKIYLSSQLDELENLVKEYVTVHVEGGKEVYYANKDKGFKYFLEELADTTDREHYDVADQIKREAIERLNKLPKNSIELAYAAFNDWINASMDKSLTNAQKTQFLEDAKDAAQKAEVVYNNRYTNEEVKSTYAPEISILEGFLLDPENATAAEMVSSCRDNRGAVRVTARYVTTKEEVKVIPKTISLKVYPSFNGSASRNATQLIKASDDKGLSVAYLVYIEFYTDYGRVYNLPTKDKQTGRSIEYQVEIDLDRYYQLYLKGQNYYSDEKSSISDAYKHITKEGYEGDTSLCYSYESGKIEQLNYTFDGENIVFYTKTFSNFCFAGIDTSTMFQNPLFWVLVAAVIILLIIVIKIIVKHTKYSVKFYSNGGSPVKKIRASKNEYFVMPAPPVKQNFVFAGWYTDKALTNKFIGVQMRRRKSFKLYAKWSAPVTKDRLQEFYDILRKSMVGYQKVSFKPTLGLVEKEHLVSMYLHENNVEIFFAEDPEVAKKLGFNVNAHTDKKFSELPSQMIVSSESTFAEALDFIKKVFTDKGLQLRADSDRANDKMTVVEDRENGFAYFITNERVANTPADFAELLRIAIKGYVLEEDNGIFKEGDVFTFARVYATEKQAQLYLPVARGEKRSRSREARFEDTPVLVDIMSASDLTEAYKAIERVMLSYGFSKNPESSNDLKDVPVPEGHGFAYTLRF